MKRQRLNKRAAARSFNAKQGRMKAINRPMPMRGGYRL